MNIIPRSRLGTIIKNKNMTRKQFSDTYKISGHPLNLLCRGYYDKVNAYQLYKVSSALRISADFIVRKSEMPNKIKETSIAKDITIHQFREFFDINMKISELIELCTDCDMTIDEMFMYEYV